MGTQPPLATHTSTYDHTHLRTRDPVRSPIDKKVRARLVVGWVTTSESLVLYVFLFLSLLLLSAGYIPLRISLSSKGVRFPGWYMRYISITFYPR